MEIAGTDPKNLRFFAILGFQSRLVVVAALKRWGGLKAKAALGL
jgi:hypothetical protein